MSNVSQQFAEGELVTVQIRNARVVSFHPGNHAAVGEVTVAMGFHNIEAAVPLAYGVTLDRVAPAEWPPQLGDIWSDRDGTEWAAGASDGETVVMWRIGGKGAGVDALDVLQDRGPVRLVRRRGWTPATNTAPAEPEPEQVDKRAAMVAGFRALADLLEAHPEIPMGASLGGQTYYLGLGDDAKIRAAIERDAATLGVTLRERQHSTDPACTVISGEYPVGGGVALALHASVAAVAPLPRREPTNDGCMSLDEALADADALGLLAATLGSEVTA